MKNIKMTEDGRNNLLESMNNLYEDVNNSRPKNMKNEDIISKSENSNEIQSKNTDLLASRSNNLNFLNDEEQDKNTSKNLEKNKKFSFFEQNMKYKLKINIDYSDLDKQKAEISPKMLFKKRKLEAFENINNINNSEEKTNNLNNNFNQTSSLNNFKIHMNLKNCFEKYLDFVHSSYFNSVENLAPLTMSSAPNQNLNINAESVNNTIDDSNDDFTKSVNNFRFSSLDLLMSPLRQKFVFESWSPYEVALFECCICKYNKNFDIFYRIVRIIFLIRSKLRQNQIL